MFKSRLAIVVLVAAFFVLFFNSGQRFSMGLMLKPMVDDLGWTRSTLSLAVTTFLVVSALALPLAGRMVDKFGAVAVLSVSVFVAGISTSAMAYIDAPWQAFVLYGLLFAVGSGGTSITPIGVLVNHWFPSRVGLANSVAISGMGLGQLLVITVLAAQLDVIGWREAFFWLGVSGVVVVVPLLILVSVLVKTGAPANSKQDETPVRQPQRNLREVLATQPIWLLFAIYALCGLQDFFVATHVVAFALDQEVPARVAGNMLALMGLMGLGGVLLTGFFADRYGPAHPTLVCFILRVVLFGLILTSQDLWVILGFALLYGSTFWITAPLTVVFVRNAYGTASLGMLAGMVTMVHHSFGGLGAYVGALSFDRTGSYNGAFWVMLVTSVVCVGVVWLLSKATERSHASSR